MLIKTLKEKNKTLESKCGYRFNIESYIIGKSYNYL